MADPAGGLLAWLVTTLRDVDAEIRAMPHDDPAGDAGPYCCEILYEGASGRCTCGLAARQATALHSVEVDRALLDEHDSEDYDGALPAPVCPPCEKGSGCGCCSETVPAPCRHVRLVASRYRHRPGYDDQAWRPTT